MTTQEKIRTLAIRAGLANATGTQVPMHKLEAFAALLLDDENEACALVCEEIATGRPIPPELFREKPVYTCAAAIRARRKQ